jgi:hypothetical protein
LIVGNSTTLLKKILAVLKIAHNLDSPSIQLGSARASKDFEHYKCKEGIAANEAGIVRCL